MPRIISLFDSSHVDPGTLQDNVRCHAATFCSEAFCFRNPRAFTASACVSSDDARMSRRNIWEQSGNKSSSHVLSRAISRVLISCMVSSLTGVMSRSGWRSAVYAVFSTMRSASSLS
ncbi:hypothetical protein BZ01_11180 [Escherichia coli O111:NM str. K6897]|nr:hypothetical protein BZ01_11180 [Escherichia coli O111:NM str. K6897]